MRVKCFIDEHGFRRAKVDSPYEMFGWYLEQDVQGSVTLCKEVLNRIEKIKNCQISFWCGTGNAHTITIEKSKVILQNEYADEDGECEILLKDFEILLIRWMKFIEKTNV